MSRVLDVGAGDGWFAMSLERMRVCNAVTAIDVKPRSENHHPVQVYNGEQLPFADKAFDLVYAVDVVHHAVHPLRLLQEMSRCTKRYLLLKDHTWRTTAGRLALAAMDEVGNRRFGVPSVYKYQREWEWNVVLEGAGLRQIKCLHPLACHVRLLGWLTNELQFLALWERG
jgi:SAM-dependent methyltransferase